MVDVSALFGYAIGTAQVVAIEWFRRRAEHRRQLTALRAELRRLLTFERPFVWDKITGPVDDRLPNPPTVSPKFFDLVMAIDFHLTDEHDDDNTQGSIMLLADGCEQLNWHHRQTLSFLEKLDSEVRTEKREQLRGQAIASAEHYDKILAMFRTTTTDTVRDIDRRLVTIRLWRQLNRPMGRLPKGKNPEPLTLDDSRIERRDGQR